MNYANHYAYGEINPYEIVHRVSDKTIAVRKMDVKRDPEWKPEFHVGVFSAHCTNQREQRWNITSNPENRVIRIRLSKSGVWEDTRGRKFVLSEQPVKFYDYNY